MLKSYFKIAVKVLQRNKLYTFISLFGISFTLMVLILVSAVLQNELGANPPLTEGKRILFVPTLIGEGFHREKVTTYDTTYVNGEMKIDSAQTIRVNEGVVSWTSSSSLSYAFYKDKIQQMKTPEHTSIFIDYAPLHLYPEGKKLALTGNLTDHNYWNIFDFTFLEGGPFTEQEVENQANIIILRESVAAQYFGLQKSYLGREIIWGLKGPFKVTGIVKDVVSTNRAVRGDFFLPLTWDFSDKTPEGIVSYFGNHVAALLARDESGVNAMIEELRTVESTIDPTQDFDRFTFREKDLSDIYAWNFIGSQMKREGKKFLAIVFGVLAVFVLIPILNLVNLNTTRTYERASEIGVRKAFGATTKDLLLQFLLENLVITVIGGLVGGVMAFAVLKSINSSGLFGNAHFDFNMPVLLISIGVTFAFGILSGILPAWRVAKTQVAQTLKSGNL